MKKNNENYDKVSKSYILNYYAIVAFIIGFIASFSTVASNDIIVILQMMTIMLFFTISGGLSLMASVLVARK